MAEIDSLEIKISANAEKANTAIRHLTRSIGALSASLKFDTTSLEKLGKINGNNFKKLGDGLQSFANAAKSLQNVDSNNFKKLSDGLTKIASIDSSKLEALGRIDGNSFRGLGEGVKALSSGLQNLQGIKKSDFNRLASGIERLAVIQPGNMETVGNALRPLADGINILSNAKFDNKNLQSLINSLTRLSNANTGSLANIDFSTLGNSINGLAQTLSKAEEVKQNTISMTNSIAKLASAGENAGENAGAVTAALPELGKRLKEFMQTMSGAKKVSEETIAFTQAIGMLASAGKRAATTAEGLGALGDNLKAFFEKMSAAPNVSQNTIRMTEALARLASQGGRTTSVTNNLGSSIGRLSGLMRGFHGSTGKAVNSLKSFTRQILSGMGIYLGIYGAIQGIRKSISIASSLTEVQNVVDVTFSDMAYKVEEFAETSIEKFGMSELALKQYASRFQAMGTAMGIDSGLIKDANSFLSEQTDGYIGLSDSMADVSLNLTKLTADMASLYDMDQKLVAEDLAAIFTGMTVPLRTYGLDLTQATLSEWAMKNGLDANIKSMSQAEKTMLRYQYVLANTKAAQGDFERTQYTWANQVRILKQNFEQLAAVIGGVLVNAFKPIVIAVNKAMSGIIAFAKTISNALGKIFGWKYEEGGGAGIAEDFGSAADSAGDIAGSTGEAADNIKEMKAGLRAFDELKTISMPEPTGGSGGGGGGGAGGGAGGTGAAGGDWVKGDSILKEFESEIDSLYELGKYIGDTLTKALNSIDWDSVYEKARNFGKGLAEFLNGLISPELFSALGRTIANSINTALHFLDSFGETFDWKNFGKSLGSGLNAFMKNLQWDTALSAAKNWGDGIARALNSFLYETDFFMIGSTLANALNTAIQFALSLGTKIEFKTFGEKLADSINGFFKTFSFKGLAETINIWVKGALDMASSFLKKTDFEAIGKKIGQLLAGLDLMRLVGKIAKVILRAINGAIKALKGMIEEAPLETVLVATFGVAKFTKFGRALSGNLMKVMRLSVSNALLSPGGFTSALKSGLNGAVSVAKNVFNGLKNVFSGGNVFGNINNSIANLRANMSSLAKGVTVVTAGFLEFDIVSGSAKKLANETGNIAVETGKIVGATALASAAMYAAFGPAGIAIGIGTGIVAAINGISEAMEEIKTEVFAESLNDALSNPGGVSIDELTENVSTSIRNIGDEFSNLSTKSEELDAAEKNIEDIRLQIQLVEEQLNAGIITSEEATDKFNALLSQLQSAVSTKIGAINGYMLSAFGEGGAWGTAWSQAGFDASEAVGKTLGLTSEMQTKFNELVEELANTDPTSPRWKELQTQLYGVIGETDGLEKALTSFDYKMSGIEIDYSKIATEEGELNEEYVESSMEKISSAVKTTNGEIEAAGEEMASNLQEAIDSAKEAGDSDAVEYFSKKLEELPKVIEYQKEQVALQAKNMTDALQSGLVDEIGKMVDNAQKEWDGLTDEQKNASGATNATSYAEAKINDYVNNVIKPFSENIEQELGELGAEGAGWSAKAGQEIIDGIFDYTYKSTNIPQTEEAVLSGWKGIIENVTSQVSEMSKEFGEGTVTGYAESIRNNADMSKSSIDFWMDKNFNAIHDSKMRFGSPSLAAKDFGRDTVLGYNEGLKENSGSTKQAISDWIQNAMTAFKAKWSEFEQSFKSSIESMWSSTIKPQFTTEKWRANIGSIKEAVSKKWQEMNDWLKSTAITGFWSKVKTDFSSSKWKNNIGSIKNPFNQKWTEMRTWMNGIAIPQFWTKFQSSYTTEKWKSKIGSIKSAMQQRWDEFKSWWNNLAVDFPKIKMPHFSMSGEFNLETGSVPTVSVQYYAAGGFPEDGWFRASHGEIMGRFDNGQSVVANNKQITDGISSAVQRGNQENNALMRQEISLLRTQNEILTGILRKEFGITKNDIGKAAQDYSREYLRTKGVPAYDF